ncbi:unnamed protein product [Linum trigynum]|uniref:Disease resistance protein At4g27190-like leucine-rich repeats domain-containing protein n=1 Tax=Linum trigynum TaxID=586398 RepID=A0AAV2DS41_9ROSI
MVSTPKFSAHVEHVELWGVKNELLDHLVDSLPPPSSPLLSRFTSLKLHEIEGLLVLPQGLLPHLTCLESLSIDRCKDFTTLSPAVIQHLTSLQRLELSSCPCLASWKGGYDHGGDEKKNKMTMMPMCALPCLHSLRFFNLPKLLHLPEWLRHSSNLQKLQMNDCVALKGLPEWLTKLAAVKSLEVNSCGDLSTRCRGQTALDWPYIAQIPNIEVDDRVIQKDGCYLGLDQGQGEGNSEDEDDDEEEEEEEESAQDKLANGFARLTCGLFRRCFLC